MSSKEVQQALLSKPRQPSVDHHYPHFIYRMNQSTEEFGDFTCVTHQTMVPEKDNRPSALTSSCVSELPHKLPERIVSFLPTPPDKQQ